MTTVLRNALTCLAIILSIVQMSSAIAACDDAHIDREKLQATKAAHWASEPAYRATLIEQLLDCLSSPDPELRDGIAYEGLAALLRSGQLGTVESRHIEERAIALMREHDAQGFAQAFGALTLSEIVRADRRQAFLTLQERDTLLDTTCRYLTELRDYRGFDPIDGWRHGIAHSADILKEFVRREDLTPVQLDKIRKALLVQLATPFHSYVYGEGERLAAPVFYATLTITSASIESENWQQWLSRLPEQLKQQPGQSELYYRTAHNIKSFLYPLFVLIQERGTSVQRAEFQPIIWHLLEQMP